MICILSIVFALITTTLSLEVDITTWLMVGDNTTLPDSSQMIGYNYSSDTIIIASGESYETQLSVFDGDTEMYNSIDSNETKLSDAKSQSDLIAKVATDGYYQVPGEDLVYFIEYDSDEEVDLLISYDTTTGVIEEVSAKNNSLVKNTVCIDEDGSTGGYLYVAGKLRGVSGPQIGAIHRYDIDSDTWVDTWSGMDTPTNVQACAIYDGDLFLFGGVQQEANTLTDDIAYCPGDSATECTVLSGVTLSVARMGIEAVTIHDMLNGRYVVLIGGIDQFNSENPSAVVEVFDMANQTITTVESLNYARKFHVAQYDATNGKIFVFNGENSDSDKLGTAEVTEVYLPTVDPTTDPTNEPTLDPTTDPTSDPTVDPTEDPTFDPTWDPSTNPTTEPTWGPTYDPTEPSFDPTTNPTVEPTWGPTYDPTEPTVEPTIDPTNEPTISKQPTESPSENPTESPTKEYSPSNTTYTTKVTVYVLVIVVLVIICCLVCLCLWYYNKEEEKRAAASPPVVIVAAVALGGCYKCGNNDCNGNDCGQNCRKCGENECDGVNCGEQCQNCGETGCNSQQCYAN